MIDLLHAPAGAIFSAARQLPTGYRWCDRCTKFVETMTVAVGSLRYEVCKTCFVAAGVKDGNLPVRNAIETPDIPVVALVNIFPAPPRQNMEERICGWMDVGAYDALQMHGTPMPEGAECDSPATEPCKVCEVWFCWRHYSVNTNTCDTCSKQLEMTSEDMESEDGVVQQHHYGDEPLGGS